MMFMFDGATKFNQDLGLWNVKNVGSMNNMLTGVTLSQTNIDNTIFGWSNLSYSSPLQTGVTFNYGNTAPDTGNSTVNTAINNLETNYNWTIST